MSLPRLSVPTKWLIAARRRYRICNHPTSDCGLGRCAPPLRGRKTVAESQNYGEAASDEIEILRARLSVPAVNIILIHELPTVSPFSITVMWDRIDEITTPWSRFVVAANLVDTARPNTQSRHELTRRIAAHKGKLIRLVAATGNNAVIRAAAWFVLGRSGIPVSVVGNEEQALERAHQELSS